MNHTLRPGRLLFALGLLAATSTVGFAWFSAPRSTPASATASAPPSAPPSAPNEALEQAMHQMDESMKVLGKGVKEENRDAALEELARFQSAVLTAKALTPDSAAKVDEKKRAAHTHEFRKTLVEALQFTCVAETAILDGKYKEADTVIRNKLGGVKSTGHGKFKQDGGGK